MESWYADFQNTGTADGSLVKSGLFLEQFRTVPWAHLDIGGTGVLPQGLPVRDARRRRASPTRRSSSSRWRGAAKAWLHGPGGAGRWRRHARRRARGP